jgi:multidrug efflux system membrane fusion protein
MANEPAAGPELDKAAKPTPEGRFPWKIVLVILLIAGVAAFTLIRRKKTAAAGDGKGPPGKGFGGGAGMSVSAVIGTVETKNVPIFLDGLGTVQAFNTVTVRCRVEGTLEKIHFREGQDVRAGDLLAQLDAAPFKSMVLQAEGKKAQDEAQLENARIELKRNATLLANKIVSQEVYDAAEAQVRQLEAAVKADEAAVESARVQLAYTTIQAPIDGRTGIRLVDEGNVIRSGDSNGIVVLTQLRPISLMFTLPEQALHQIQARQAQSEMTVVGVDRDNSTVLEEGKLTVFDNQIDTSTGTIRLKAAFVNKDLKLWPGQFVNARLLLEVRTNGMVVPASVVQRGPEGAYAFVVEADMSVRMAPIKVVQVEKGEALIESGVKPGQRVVVDGQYKLQPGSKVKPAQPEGSAAPGTNTESSSSRKGPPSGKAGKTHSR